MNTFIDILSRLIIATITFVAPMIVFCFGVFYDALRLSANEREEKKEALIQQAFSLMSVNDSDKEKVIVETAKKINNNRMRSKIVSFIFHPKVHIVCIFALLFISLSSLMFSHLVLGNVWKMYNVNLWRFFVHLSTWSYFLSVIIIVIFVRNAVLMKEKVETNKSLPK